MNKIPHMVSIYVIYNCLARVVRMSFPRGPGLFIWGVFSLDIRFGLCYGVINGWFFDITI